MTKKHFIEAARIVKSLQDVDPMHAATVADAFVELFRQFNGRFDVERFRQACGFKG